MKARLRERYRKNPSAYNHYNREKNRQSRIKRRLECLAAYGNKCVCCDETTIEFLGIDHVNGGGNEHRRNQEIRNNGIYAWLKRRGYPAGFQVLCHNCNLAKGFYGQCPHKRERENAPNM